jgi:hypothetical protein
VGLVMHVKEEERKVEKRLSKDQEPPMKKD